MASTAPTLTRVATYERTVHASLERVWENVLDWEHLPSLHASSFSSIRCLDAGDHGWSARIGLPPKQGGPEITLELRRDAENLRYVSATVDGPGAGSEIWTYLHPVAEDRTDIRVEFLLPGIPPEQAESVGRGFVALYTRLWDEDEAMMQHRERMLAVLAGKAPKGFLPLELGPLDEVRKRLPLHVEMSGRPFRVVEIDGELLCHSTICPHWFGPLDDAEVEPGGVVECPWHGYRFDLREGRRCDGPGRMRLAAAPRVEIDPATGVVRLV